MAGITTGVGLISGINTAQLIDQLIALEARPKLVLQQRISILQARKSALLDINARMLNLKSTAKGLRLNKVFDAAKATSSNASVLTATASSDAQPGTFSFLVKRLASFSQVLSRGFADSTSTPLGLGSLSIEFGKGRLTRDVNLADLNGGAGVRRGKILITDTTGAHTVDLSDVATINDVLERINGSAANVTASVSGDRLVIAEDSAGSVTIANAAGSFTATDLGITGTAGGGTLTGSIINRLGGASALAHLNDGNGVLVRNGVASLRLQLDADPAFDINLGRVDEQITASTTLADLNGGQGVAINADHTAADLRIITRSGTSVDIKIGNLYDDEDELTDDAVKTVGQLLTRVNAQLASALGSSDVQLAISGDSNQFVLVDNSAGSGTLQIIGAGPNGTQTATDLGLLATDGGAGDLDATPNQITGSTLINTVQTPAAATLQDIIDRIEDQTSGAITGSVAPDGVSLRLTAGGGQAITILAGTGDGSPYGAAIAQRTLRDLGFTAGQTAVGSISGGRLVASLGSVLVNSLNGGSGLSGASTLTITDRQGHAVTINNLDQADSLSDLLTAIGDAITASGNVDVTVGRNASGNGLLVNDTSGATGSNLIITGDAATALGIATGGSGVASSTVRGSNLQLQYVSAASRLSELNYGRGVGQGSFRLTDGFGRSAVVNVTSSASTLYDVAAIINSRGLALSARINDTGDGLLIEQDLTDAPPGATPFAAIKVAAITGATAKDLNILGTSSTIVGGAIDGSHERSIAVEPGDTLSKLVTKINAAKLPVTASMINAGSGPAPWRLNLSSAVSGAAGDLILDSGGIDLGLTTISQGRDARVFFGSSDPAQAQLISSGSNTIKNVVQGVTIDLVAAHDSPMTLTVARDIESIVAAVKGFAAAFNDAVQRIDSYDFFNTDTEERGPLLGNPSTARARALLIRTIQGVPKGVQGQFRLASQIGLKLGAKSQVTFDEARFRAAYESDPDAVEELLAGFASTTSASQEISPGVTVISSEETFSTVGLGDTFDQAMAALTDSVNGALTLADEGFQDQIDLANARIKRMDARLAKRRELLQAQFLAMETTLARLQAQGNALGALSANVALAQSAFGA